MFPEFSHAPLYKLTDCTEKMSSINVRRSEDRMIGNWSIGAGRPFPPDLPDRGRYLVDFDGPDDQSNPQNWPSITK
jgi:hypothetical protein